MRNVLCVIALCGSALLVEAQNPPQPKSAAPRVVHVVVALCDNKYQGIVPVAPVLGNGDDPARNLYWGGGYGVRAFFQISRDWERVGKCDPGKYPVLERCVFRHKRQAVYMVADAYRGREIKRAMTDFFAYAAGKQPEPLTVGGTRLVAGGGADLVTYIGHDGLMEFSLDEFPRAANSKRRDAIMLACISKYFAAPLRSTGAKPLLWTRHLMAPEAYILDAALTGWMQGETDEQIRTRAAQAYNRYQHCGAKAADRMFATGW